MKRRDDSVRLMPKRCIISLFHQATAIVLRNGVISVWNEIRIPIMCVPVNHERSFRFFFLKLRKPYSNVVLLRSWRTYRASFLIVYATDVEKCNGQMSKMEHFEIVNNAEKIWKKFFKALPVIVSSIFIF